MRVRVLVLLPSLDWLLTCIWGYNHAGVTASAGPGQAPQDLPVA
jgi:hypothetical protein